MVGQKRLLQRIEKMAAAGFPRFVILYGGKNSGKRTVCKQIAKLLKAHYVVGGNKVDDVRELIALAYRQREPILYAIPEADKMSAAAKNALLKITEEPPVNAYFILTTGTVEGLLETLKSRATLLKMDPYSPDELIEYAELKGYKPNRNEQAIIKDICNLTGDVDILMAYDVEAFFDYAVLMVENIQKVSGANALKIGSKLATNKNNEGWDIALFMRAVIRIYAQKMWDNPLAIYQKCIEITMFYLSELNITGINKAALVDMWILELRGV